MAEAYMNAAASGRWRAYSAGSKPTGTPNPYALETLKANDIPAVGGDGPPHSKSWDAFAASGDEAQSADVSVMDAVVTVCDNAAGEVCPVWPHRAGRPPQKYHWSFPDPAAATGDAAAIRAEFQSVFEAIKTRLDAFLADDDTAA